MVYVKENARQKTAQKRATYEGWGIKEADEDIRTLVGTWYVSNMMIAASTPESRQVQDGKSRDGSTRLSRTNTKGMHPLIEKTEAGVQLLFLDAPARQHSCNPPLFAAAWRALRYVYLTDHYNWWRAT